MAEEEKGGKGGEGERGEDRGSNQAKEKGKEGRERTSTFAWGLKPQVRESTMTKKYLFEGENTLRGIFPSDALKYVYMIVESESHSSLSFRKRPLSFLYPRR